MPPVAHDIRVVIVRAEYRSACALAHFAQMANRRVVTLLRRPAKQDIRVPREGEFNHSDLIMISASRC